jgi:hypothetical protein
MLRRRAVVFGLVAVLAAAGCGGDGEDGGGGGNGESTSSEERAARDAVERYVGALVDNDPRAACDLQTKQAREAAAEEVPGASSCERAHEIILGVLGSRVEQLDEQLAKALTEVKVSGDTAVLTSPREPGKELKLRREGGEWKVDDKVLNYTPN